MDSCEDAFKGDYIVVKEEYIGHVQERMGPGLRELKRKRKGEKLLNGKLIGRNGKLTDEVSIRFKTITEKQHKTIVVILKLWNLVNIQAYNSK